MGFPEEPEAYGRFSGDALRDGLAEAFGETQQRFSGFFIGIEIIGIEIIGTGAIIPKRSFPCRAPARTVNIRTWRQSKHESRSSRKLERPRKFG